MSEATRPPGYERRAQYSLMLAAGLLGVLLAAAGLVVGCAVNTAQTVQIPGVPGFPSPPTAPGAPAPSPPPQLPTELPTDLPTDLPGLPSLPGGGG